MRSMFLFTLLAACGFVPISQAGRPQYSVGFDFSLDYAVASIYFANNTFADVATVQGDEAYRQAMRIFMSITPDKITFLPIEQSSLGPIQQQLPTWLHHSMGRLCSYLPSSWLSEIHLDDTARAFAPMLHTLKTATESHLGVVDSLHSVGVSLPQPISPQLFGSLQTTASSASLNIYEPRLSRLPAGVHAAGGSGVAGECRSFPRDECDEERLMLIIGYSRAALTAMLIHEDMPIYRTLRTIHSEALGEAELDRRCSSPDRMESDCTEALRAALKDITQLPVSEDEDAKDLTFIQTIVLRGESATHSRLNSVLREVLRRDGDDEDDSMMAVINGGNSSIAVSPVHAAARGIAEIGMFVLEQPLLDGCNCNDFTRRRMC